MVGCGHIPPVHPVFFCFFVLFFSPLAGNYKNTASGCCVGGLVLAERRDYQKCILSFLICRQDDWFAPTLSKLKVCILFLSEYLISREWSLTRPEWRKGIRGCGSDPGQGPRPGISLSRRGLINRETMISDTFIATQRQALPPFEKCLTNRPSIFYHGFLLHSGSWGCLEPIPAVLGWGRGYTLDKTPVYHSAT